MIRIEDLHQLYLKNPSVSTDTRKIKPGDIFFCLKGENFDGNQFAPAAATSGASYIIIDDPEFITVPNSILVDDALIALQDLARYHRKQFSIPLIGITGTNGKTTTKELVAAVLEKRYQLVATQGNLNNHIGVPLSLLRIDSKTDMAIIEMGASHPGEIAELCEIAQPNAGIITNVGKAHLEGFGDEATILDTKTALYKSVAGRKGVIWVSTRQEALKKRAAGLNTILYGDGPEASFPSMLCQADPFTEIAWGENYRHRIQTHLAGSWNYENIIAAVAIGLYFDVSPGDINSALESYHPSNMRSQVLQTGSNTIILDAYNANPSSMQAAIEHFRGVSAENKMLILGDMLELGSGSDAEHLKILELVKNSRFKQVILVGPQFNALTKDPEMLTFSNTQKASEWLQKNPPEGVHILIKGSRGIGLERLLDSFPHD